MRLWHYELLPYLPDLQFKGQLRELVAIMHDWRDKGKTNHILINKVMEYDKHDLYSYFMHYFKEYSKRYIIKPSILKTRDEFIKFAELIPSKDFHFNGKGEIFTICYKINPFDNWHTKEYLRSNMANLWEKHFMGVGKSRISDEEWETLLRGYKEITGEEYKI